MPSEANQYRSFSVARSQKIKQPGRPALDLLTRKGYNAELAYRWLHIEMSVCVSLVRRYDEMADKLSGHPEDTEALVNLQHFLNTVNLLIHSFNSLYF